jgi:hypothetical protein
MVAQSRGARNESYALDALARMRGTEKSCRVACDEPLEPIAVQIKTG